MPKVRVLPPELASQIAAGEVAERPASVVKELLENALDAEAQRCDVEIEGGGILRLSVADDGFGMSEEDAALSVERHATSKLSAVSDLMKVRSYGFRGEALPSIASVSRFSLRTRPRDGDAGVEVLVEGGSKPVLRALGMSVGTRVEVNDLFYNVPARRKFLRSSATESGHITEVLENAALARPDVTFTLVRDGRRVRELLRVGSRKERVAQQLGDEALAPCTGERGPLAVEAYLSRPESARTGAGGLRLFVNGRPVRDRALAVTIAHAYGSVLERGRYPRGVVYLELPPELVDVNVHPQKAEVRFADPRAVSDALYGILTRALSSAFSLPPARSGRSFVGSAPRAAYPTSSAFGTAVHGSPTAPGSALDIASPQTALPDGSRALGNSADTASAGDGTPADRSPAFAPYARHGSAPGTDSQEHTQVANAAGADAQGEYAAPSAAANSAVYGEGVTAALGPLPAVLAFRDSARSPIEPNPNVAWASLRFVAQLKLTYLLCEGADGLYLLDQHAAAERVTFTKLRRQYQSRAVPAQSLLFPTMVEVSAQEAELVESRGKELLEVGLDVRVRGAETVSIHAVPKLLAGGSPERMLRDLLVEATRKGERAFSDAVDLALATMACHGSVRAGDALAPSEVQALLAALDGADFAGHCPHGRPVVTFIGWAELERKVGRR
ncbi:MAG TPA: DNA mismatch repair endonuclease MutL [Polyangiaceae bacterium]|nr:DNA mismatch repair endonuclease MutL [Polyangiaceae bacterium]